MRTDEAVPIVETKLLTAMENTYGNYTRAGVTNKGWFKAPAAGNYKFYMSCDDFCQLFLDQTKFNKTTPVEPARSQIAIRHFASYWRDYYMTPDPDSSTQYQSEWIALEEGEFYSIESFAGEYTGTDHHAVSVEYEQADTAGHHHAGKQIQLLEVNPENTVEKFNITVENANGGSYQIRFLNPLYDSANRRSV